jgi:hypothetical protein
VKSTSLEDASLRYKENYIAKISKNFNNNKYTYFGIGTVIILALIAIITVA